MRRAVLLSGLVGLLAASVAARQGEDKPKAGAQAPSPPAPGLFPLDPPTPPPDPTPKRVRIQAPPPPAVADSAEAGALRGVRAASVVEGEARLLLADGERTVKPGDAIGPDVVRSIAPGQIVLLRGGTQAEPEGTAMVVIKFDPRGRGTVRVYHHRDPSPRVVPEVK